MPHFWKPANRICPSTTVVRMFTLNSEYFHNNLHDCLDIQSKLHWYWFYLHWQDLITVNYCPCGRNINPMNCERTCIIPNWQNVTSEIDYIYSAVFSLEKILHSVCVSTKFLLRMCNFYIVVHLHRSCHLNKGIKHEYDKHRKDGYQKLEIALFYFI